MARRLRATYYVTAAACVVMSLATAEGQISPRSGTESTGRFAASVTSLEGLKRRARRGDKYAQYDLGQRLENGDGVPRDMAEAIKWYRRAARDDDGVAWIYEPSGIRGKAGRVVQVRRTQPKPGLAKAKLRLQALQQGGCAAC